MQNERDRIVSHKRVVLTSSLDIPSLSVNSLYEAEIRAKQVKFLINLSKFFSVGEKPEAERSAKSS